MDLQFGWMLLRVIMALLFVLFLIYLSMKYGGNKLQYIQKGRYIKVLERTSISKENLLVVVKMGSNGFVIASTNDKMEIISQLTKEEIEKIEESKAIPQYENLREFYEKAGLKSFYEKNLRILYKKLKLKKEDSTDE